MFTLTDTSNAHIYVTDDLISKVRSNLVDNGQLKETLLLELQAIWKSKMRQAGLDIGESSSSSPISKSTPSENAETNDQSKPLMDQNLYTGREHIKFNMPQQDGSNNVDIVVTEPNTDASNDDNDEESLNEDDDEEDVIDENDMDDPNMVLCQFDQVNRSKNNWKCKFISGIMQISGKSLYFTEGYGAFDF